MDAMNTIAPTLSIKGNKISAIGAPPQGGDVSIDISGRTILPGLIDAHTHLELLAQAWEIAVDHRSPGVKKIDDLVRRLQHRAESMPAGKWILGQGSHYQDQLLEEHRYPDRQDLDRASLAHPIVCRFSFHTNVLNSKALEVLGVTRDTPNSDGGRLERDERGELTGRVFDMYQAIGGPQWPPEEVGDAIVKMQQRYFSVGVTSVGEFIDMGNELGILAQLYHADRLKLRISAYPKAPDAISFDSAFQHDISDIFGQADPLRLRLAGIKLFLDGGLTSMAAALHEPYATSADHRGELCFAPGEFFEIVRRLHEVGHQVAVHAIGDRALDIAIEAFARLPSPRPAGWAPHRIEHAGNAFWTEQRARLMKRHNILPVPQPSFIYTTAAGYRRHLGKERGRNLFPIRTMLSEGFPLPGNSDAIGVDARQHVPFLAIQCLLSRTMSNGEILDASEAIGMHDALTMYTRHAADSLGLGEHLGSLEVGKLADFIILNRDPRDLASDELIELSIDETWVGGERVYVREGSAVVSKREGGS